MKRFSLLVSLLLSLFFLPHTAEATHMQGVDATYECLNNCTIRVHLRAYRDCSGAISISNNLTFNLVSGNCTGQPTPVTAWSPQFTQEVTPLCPGAATRCTQPNATINGVQEYYWYRDFDICSQPNCIFSLSWSGCCRNGIITSGAANQGMGINSTTVNTGLANCNSSPQFSNPPVPYICAGQPYTFNQGATDPEGDSLSYSLGPCYTNNLGTTQVTYAGGYSFTQPLGPTWNVQINSQTGDITVTPQPGNVVVGVMCVYVEEWRNGVLINTIVRDIQMNVLNCPANTLPVVNNLDSVSGAVATGFVVNTCLGNNVCFQLPSIDPDTNQTVTAFWNNGIPGGTFFQTGNPSNTDTIVGTVGNPPSMSFCWTPTANGIYSFLVTLQDDACPVIGQNQFTIQIVVGDVDVNIQANSPGCGTINFCAQPLGGVAPFNYQWTGLGGLTQNPNSTDSCLTHNYGQTGTFQYILSITDTNGCSGADTGQVSVVVDVTAATGPNINFCSGFTGTIGTPALTGYSYQWSPATGLSNPTAAQTNVTLTNTGTTPIVQQYIITATNSSNQCVGTDTVEVTVWPEMNPSTAPVAVSCSGGNDGTAAVNITGGVTPFTYQWDQSTGFQTTQTASGLVAGTYSVTVTDSAGCTTTTTATITEPTPVVATANSVPVTCNAGSDGEVSALATGGVGGYTYTWLPPLSQVGQTIQNVSAGSYTVVASDANGCTDTISVLVIEPTALQVALSSSPTTCALPNDNGSAGATVTGGTPGYTYLWDDPQAQTTQTATGLAAGTYTVTVTDGNGCQNIQSIVVGEILPPTVSTGQGVSFCEGEGGAQISATAAGGTPGYWYTWTCGSVNCGLSNVNGQNPNANPTSTTMYYVQVTDTNGCTSNLDSVLVTVDPKPIVDAGPDLYLCGDSAACQILQPSISGAPGPYSYTWINGLGLNDSTILNPCARPDTTTLYTLVVTAGNGCTSDFTTTDTLSTVTVHVNPIPVAEAGPDRDICFGDSIMLQGLGTGAGPNYTFEWSPNNGLSSLVIPNPMASPSLTTVYTLVVWSNNCPSYGDPVVVNVHTLPTPDAGPDQEICLGETAQLDGQASGDSTATYSFVWTPDTWLSDPFAEDPLANPPSTTTYYMTATSNYGCESPVDSMTVYLKPTPVAEAGDNPTICLGNDYQLNGSYYYTTTDSADPADIFFAWTPNVNMTDSTLTDPVVTPTQSGWYYFTVYTNTCATTDSVFITVIPEIGLAATADTNITCEGDSVALSATAGIGGASFMWMPPLGLGNPNSANTMAAPNVTTTYQVIASEGGCADTAEVTIEVIPGPAASYLSSLPQGCAPHTVSFSQNSTNGILYVWDFGDGSPVVNEEMPTHIYTDPGTYTVTLTAIGIGGCASTVNSMQIEVGEQPIAEFTSDPEFPIEMSLPNTGVNFTNESQGGVTYQWEFGNGNVSSEFHASTEYTSPGEYFVTLTATNALGCVDQVTHGPYIIKMPDLFIPNVFSPNDDDVNDEFLVEYTGSQPYLLQVFDRWGNKLFETRNKFATWKGKDLDGMDTPDGTYYYLVKVGDREFAGHVTLVR